MSTIILPNHQLLELRFYALTKYKQKQAKNWATDKNWYLQLSMKYIYLKMYQEIRQRHTALSNKQREQLFEMHRNLNLFKS